MQALKPQNRIPHKHRFTLVELMVVLIIVGIMLAALAPAFNRLMTGNAVGAAERMISSQLSLARAEAARRRCEVAIVIYDDHDYDATLPKSSSFRAAYNPAGTWQWLPGSQETWLPTGAIVGSLVLGSITDTNYVYPLIANTPGLTVKIGGVDFPAIIFKPNGRLAQSVSLALHEASITSAQIVQLLNDNYCRVLEISQYTGRVSFSTVQKP